MSKDGAPKKVPYLHEVHELNFCRARLAPLSWFVSARPLSQSSKLALRESKALKSWSAERGAGADGRMLIRRCRPKGGALP